MANTPVKKRDSDVVAQDANVIDMSMFAVDAGIGNKEVDQESLSIPFLKTNLKYLLSVNRLESKSKLSLPISKDEIKSYHSSLPNILFSRR